MTVLKSLAYLFRPENSTSIYLNHGTNLFFFFGKTTVFGPDLSVAIVGLGLSMSDLMIFRIISPTSRGHGLDGAWTHDGHVVKVVRVDNYTTRPVARMEL